ncbi:hypothetical protein [Muribaculum intestinale]|uniref:hypothetical protein n=1 Tax=Muribaculum intestinale TaxID=1796646 RepID=UPI0025B7239C|nr:hypothetical protein [Muribaculum intestinale]
MNNSEWQKDKVIKMADTRIINYSGKSLCENYRNPLERCETAAQAIRLYKNCISWALQERYPTKEDLLAFASKETLAENGVYIDTTFDGERIDSHICCVFLGCKGWISTGLNLDKAIIPMLYLSEGSDLKVKVNEGLLHPIPVELYYGSRIGGNRKRLSIKDCNHLTAKDNIGFSEEELSVDPELNNEDL